MPQVLSHTPAWLSRPSTGFQVFQPMEASRPSTALSNGSGKKISHQGSLRLIAHRNTEIFFVIGNELRWSDLIWLKDAGEDADALKQRFSKGGSTQDLGSDAQAGLERVSRSLKVPVAGQIRQLSISPLGDFLAICTSHTIHVAILPSRFDGPNTGPVRLRTFQLGPTAHVLDQAALASAIWHPFGSLGSCLVTVTTDACVRLWELNRESRYSFDEPALALDLKKLANATSAGEDLRASVYGTSKGFSPDSVEMEVASACFGGIGSADEHGWSPMTLWVAMREGDVYALCPLLPSKWQPAASTIPSLSTSVVSKAAILENDSSASEADRRTANEQQKWLADIDSQESAMHSIPNSFETVEVYHRPNNPPAIPKLQGPFRFSPEPEFEEITDIYTMAPRVDDETLLEEDEDAFGELTSRPGVSVGVICLATQSGNVHVCLDLNGVEAQWLPPKRAVFQRSGELDDEPLDLLLLETLSLQGTDNAPSSWPTFTPLLSHRYLFEQPMYESHPAGRYGFFVSLPGGVYNCTLTPWLSNLEDELSSPNESGASFRMGLLYDSDKTEIVQAIKAPQDTSASPSACISVIDSDLGHFILTTINSQPYAASLDLPQDQDVYTSFAPDAAPLALPAPETRDPYQPSQAFYAASSLPSLLDSLTQSGTTRLRREDMKSQVRLSPATLQLLTEAHRVISDETNRLDLAAADLFRRCQRMRSELHEQIRKVREINARVTTVTGKDDISSDLSTNDKIARRMKSARDKNNDLAHRVDRLRRRMTSVSGKELSQREENWAAEVGALDDSINADKGLESRFGAVQKMTKEFVGLAKGVAGDIGEGDGERYGVEKKDAPSVPNDFRKQKIGQVMGLLERETALVEAVMARLARLGGV
ncbi:hypothetical protein MBLNU457_g0013t1 [Dothideomycetes sp. NU457]